MLFVNCFEFLLCFVLDLLVFYSALVLCFFLFDFASRSCLWPLLLFRLSFCKSRFSSLALVFGSCLAFAFYFYFSFFVYGFYLAFTSCFWLLLSFHFSLLSFMFRLWVKTHYGGPKVIDVVFIISLFHSAKLESLFQNCKHCPLRLKICGFQKSLLQKSYILFIF